MSNNTQPITVLILAANPSGLRLDQEIHDIQEAIQRSTRRDKIQIITRQAVRPKDIRRAMEIRPKIVHFCGHGNTDGSLVLENDEGHSISVNAEGLAALFELHASYVECVLINTCYSEEAAKAISKHINYVIGMNQAVNDKTAIKFAEGFYDALGYNSLDNQENFQRAFDEGILAIKLEKLPGSSIPVLLKNKRVVNPGDKCKSSDSKHELNPSDLEKLIELVNKSRRATFASRDALCRKIGIDPGQLNFLTLSADSDFAVQLINFLYQTDNKEALCKLCKDLEPIFKGGKYNDDLVAITAKLNHKPWFTNSGTYANLKYLLQEGKWKEANEETVNVIFKITKQEEKGYLNKEDIKRFPCAELREIDRLWVEFSSGRFGFSVQKRIWISVGGKPQGYHYEICKKFGERVGWYATEQDKWLRKNEYNFTLNAPFGHLPVIYWYVPEGWTVIFYRTDTCGL